MRLSFNIGRVDITIIDTDMNGYDCTDLTDDELEEMIKPSLNSGDWDPESESAYQEWNHRMLIDEGYYD